MEQIIAIDTARKLKEYTIEFNNLKDSYVFCNFYKGCGPHLSIEDRALKLEGSLVMLVRGGSEFDFDINLESYHVGPNTFIMAFPGNVVQLRKPLPDDIEASLLFFNMSFLQNVNINMSAIRLPPMVKKPSPVMQLTQEESDLLYKYFELLGLNTRDETDYHINKNIATSLIAATFYQLVQFEHKRIIDVPEDTRPTNGNAGSRRNEYVREFIRLVHVHFVRERSVSFYAEKMFISPKYLSLLVKESTGRSASRWIDDYVLMEAKNLLRFSGKNIQQVAYALNFSTQSSFGKYFKHLTGMSPTEYQKS